jgi:hypothetical protein
MTAGQQGPGQPITCHARHTQHPRTRPSLVCAGTSPPGGMPQVTAEWTTSTPIFMVRRRATTVRALPGAQRGTGSRTRPPHGRHGTGVCPLQRGGGREAARLPEQDGRPQDAGSLPRAMQGKEMTGHDRARTWPACGASGHAGVVHSKPAPRRLPVQSGNGAELQDSPADERRRNGPTGTGDPPTPASNAGSSAAVRR